METTMIETLSTECCELLAILGYSKKLTYNPTRLGWDIYVLNYAYGSGPDMVSALLALKGSLMTKARVRLVSDIDLQAKAIVNLQESINNAREEYARLRAIQERFQL
jgi:hypothetical protein